MDLIRKIVLAIEDSPTGFRVGKFTFDGYTDEQIGYHCLLLIDAGFADGIQLTGLGATTPVADIGRLTWAGHEFAEAARDDTRWNRAKRIIVKAGGAATIAATTKLLGELMNEAFHAAKAVIR